MEDEVHRIELDDGNVAPEVHQVVAEQQGARNRNQPSHQVVYNRLLHFESNLQVVWNTFTNELREEVNSLRERISSLGDAVEELQNTERRQADFLLGDSVVLLKERKFGRVTYITKKFVDVHLDDERNKNRSVRVKKTDVMRLNH